MNFYKTYTISTNYFNFFVMGTDENDDFNNDNFNDDGDNNDNFLNDN
jgi:hypothetical protein